MPRRSFVETTGSVNRPPQRHVRRASRKKAVGRHYARLHPRFFSSRALHRASCGSKSNSPSEWGRQPGSLSLTATRPPPTPEPRRRPTKRQPAAIAPQPTRLRRCGIDQLSGDPTPPPNPTAASTAGAAKLRSTSGQSRPPMAPQRQMQRRRWLEENGVAHDPPAEVEGTGALRSRRQAGHDLALNSAAPGSDPACASALRPKFASNLKATCKGCRSELATMLGILARAAQRAILRPTRPRRKLASAARGYGPARVTGPDRLVLR